MKVCIIGTSGAGKTTLSAKLSDVFNTPVYGYDEIYWDKTQQEYIKNPQSTINALVLAITSKTEWIVEGAYDKRLIPFFNDCTLIIRLIIPYRICAFRIVKRYLSSKLTTTGPKETLFNTIELLRFAKQFDKRLDDFFAQNPLFASKVIIINDNKQCIGAINKHLEQIK
ncbi:AAA family ATPase [Providencia rettgeri]|uniref:AAA family ATPase n=1 Tax=Providencia TaxID=586 RepID=UPI00109C3D27|nr:MULTISPECIES: AAA family ATPase [Providencia]MBQ0528704.1 AAA family ATPase [Providencia rettgeri]THB29071.1 AAA family ATPase [Providencia sp. MGF014]WOB87978.1 AAA family ATPase [Providencia sp. PROV040]